MDYTQTPIPWHRTRAGRVFLLILSSLGILAVGLAALTGYYYWRIQSGGRAELQTLFADQFTFNPARRDTNNATAMDPNTTIRSYSPAIGGMEAPVTIIEFIDFECPFCQAGYPIFEKVKERFEPAIRVVFKHIPVAQIHTAALGAHIAAACAQEQDKFWEYERQLFTIKKLDDGSLKVYAQTLALDMGKFNRCVQTKKYLKDIEQDIKDAADLGVRGTPTYFVNSKKYEGVIPEEVWEKIILSEMRKEK